MAKHPQKMTNKQYDSDDKASVEGHDNSGKASARPVARWQSIRQTIIGGAAKHPPIKSQLHRSIMTKSPGSIGRRKKERASPGVEGHPEE